MSNKKQEYSKDMQRFMRAFVYAQKHGYYPPSEYPMVIRQSRQIGKSRAFREWARGLLLSHDFAKAIFGDETVADDGTGLATLKMWAKQVAVEHEGKLYAAQRGRREMNFAVTPHLEYETMAEHLYSTAPSLQVVTYKLKDLVAQIPLDTHRVAEIELFGGLPAWQWHLKKMVVHDNPFKYVDYHVKNKQKKG